MVFFFFPHKCEPHTRTLPFFKTATTQRDWCSVRSFLFNNEPFFLFFFYSSGALADAGIAEKREGDTIDVWSERSGPEGRYPGNGAMRKACWPSALTMMLSGKSSAERRLQIRAARWVNRANTRWNIGCCVSLRDFSLCCFLDRGFRRCLWEQRLLMDDATAADDDADV